MELTHLNFDNELLPSSLSSLPHWTSQAHSSISHTQWKDNGFCMASLLSCLYLYLHLSLLGPHSHPRCHAQTFGRMQAETLDVGNGPGEQSLVWPDGFMFWKVQASSAPSLIPQCITPGSCSFHISQPLSGSTPSSKHQASQFSQLYITHWILSRSSSFPSFACVCALCVHVCVEARGTSGVISQMPSIFFFEAGFPFGLELTKQVSLSDQQTICLSASIALGCYEYQSMCHFTHVFAWAQGI